MGATGRVVFFTLTIDPSDGRYVAALGAYEGKGETAPSIRYGQWAWNRMTARCRARGWSFPYARGVELHASGRAHLHVIARVVAGGRRGPASALWLMCRSRGPGQTWRATWARRRMPALWRRSCARRRWSGGGRGATWPKGWMPGGRR